MMSDVCLQFEISGLSFDLTLFTCSPVVLSSFLLLLLTHSPAYFILSSPFARSVFFLFWFWLTLLSTLFCLFALSVFFLFWFWLILLSTLFCPILLLFLTVFFLFWFWLIFLSTLFCLFALSDFFLFWF